MTTYAYLRTSTADQVYGLEAQRREVLAAFPDAVIFEEHASGKAGTKRPQFELALHAACSSKGVLVVTKLDRLGRSTREVLATVDTIQRCGAALVILGLAVDTRTPTGRFTLTVFAAVAEMEREFISGRTKEGLAEARQAGKAVGGARTAGVRLDGTPSTPKAGRSRQRGRRLTEDEQAVRDNVQRYLAESLPVAQIARLAGCSESLVRKIKAAQ